MHVGVSIFPTDQTLQPVELGQVADGLGYESLWFPEHSHIPVSRDTPWGGLQGAPPLPDWYWRTHDQFVALGAVAATTENIKLATGITLVAQRDPIWMAKMAATVDQISNGRFILGIGYGWNKEELAHHGVDYRDRRAVIRERVLAAKELWTNDEAEFHGEHVDFSPSWSWPKPVQQGGPPVVLGGAAGPRTARDIAEFCDGWMPIGARHDITSGWANIEAACNEIGRDPSEIELGVFGAKPSIEALQELANLGVRRAAISLRQGTRDEVLAELERHAPLIEQAAEL